MTKDISHLPEEQQIAILEKRARQREYTRRWQLNNPEKLKASKAKSNAKWRAEKGKSYDEQTAERRRALRKQRYERDKASILSKTKEYARQNPLIRRKAERNYRERRKNDSAYKEKVAKANKVYRAKNSDVLKLKEKEKYARNKQDPNFLNKRREYVKKRREVDSQYVMAEALRVRLRQALRRGLEGVKVGSAIKDLGCTIPEFIEHIESLFLPGMSWENRGRNGWHLDHIIPLSAFDLNNRDDFLSAVNWSNIRPLWGNDNIIKRDNLPVWED